MSRTNRKNKYGEIKTDKFIKGFYGCGCVCCSFKNTDNRNIHKELFSINEIKENKNYIYERYEENIDDIIEKDYWLDELSNDILNHNLLINK